SVICPIKRSVGNRRDGVGFRPAMVDVVWSLFGDDSVKVEGEQDPVIVRGVFVEVRFGGSVVVERGGEGWGGNRSDGVRREEGKGGRRRFACGFPALVIMEGLVVLRRKREKKEEGRLLGEEGGRWRWREGEREKEGGRRR
ncbi:hypothetical protein HAX54_014996, partial [Datura stramonium]|nr:hypothetical protein [Datura stramonium]